MRSAAKRLCHGGGRLIENGRARREVQAHVVNATCSEAVAGIESNSGWAEEALAGSPIDVSERKKGLFELLLEAGLRC